MKTSESVKVSIESKEQNKTIKTGNWRVYKNDDCITIYYYKTLVGFYDITSNNMAVIYDYSRSTKCGLTKIINLLKEYNLIHKLTYANKKYEVIRKV